MALEKISNNGQSTISGSINNTSDPVTFSVASASTFPTSGNFRVLIDNEILLVTSVSGTSFTASRAQEGTAIAAHTSGAAITQTITAAGLLQFIRERSWQPYPPFVVGTYDDEFDDENFSGWTQVEPTSPHVTVTEINNQLSILHPGGDAQGMHAFMKNFTPAVGEGCEIAFRVDGVKDNHVMVGLTMADGVTYGAGNQVVGFISFNETFYIMQAYTNYQTTGASNIANRNAQHATSHAFLRLKRSATNTYQLYVSPNGIDWTQVCSNQSAGSWTPTWCGFYVTTWTGTNKFVTSVEYFKKF